jgi:hypothetical protein
MSSTNELQSHRLAALEADVKEHSEDIRGNGKKGIKERVARLEYAFAVLLVFFATHSPLAA